jgi:hypothetical protein
MLGEFSQHSTGVREIREHTIARTQELAFSAFPVEVTDSYAHRKRCFPLPLRGDMLVVKHQISDQRSFSPLGMQQCLPLQCFEDLVGQSHMSLNSL